MRLKLNAASQVVSATIAGTAVEEALKDCRHAPISPNAHTYAYAPVAASGGPFIALPGATNEPRANLVVDVAPDTAASARATLRWQRVDVDAPFDWSLGASVRLTKL